LDAPYPPHALPLSVNDADLPPLERARHLVATAKSYLLESRTQEATRVLEQAIMLDGTSSTSFEALLLLGKLGTTNPACATQAIEALRAATRIHPRAAQPWALMGEIFHRTGHWDNARGCFRRALELNPSLAIPREYQNLQEQVLSTKGQAQSQASLLERMKGMFAQGKGSRG
jgi:tetratricopeptide (TPR) repeat protein